MNVYLESQVSGNDWAEPMLEDFLRFASSPRGVDSGQSSLNNYEDQMAEFESDHRNIIHEVLKLYVLSNDEAVKEFLDGHRTIPQLLIQAAPRLQEHFGEATVFSLRVVVDEHDWQTIYAVVIWPGKAEDVVTALDEFEENWWIQNSNPASGDLTFTYELV